MISLRRRRREPDPDELDGWTERVRENAGQAVIIVLVMVVAGIAVLRGDDIRARLLDLAVRATGGSDAGLAAAGWLVPTLPLIIALLYVTVIDDLRIFVRWPYLLVLGAVAGLALMFFPGRSEEVADLVTGPGSAAFATGLRWAGASLVPGMAVLGWVHLEGAPSYRRGRRVPSARARRRTRAGSLAIAALSLAALGVALLRAV